MTRPRLDDLAAFARVARLSSFTRAAAELGTSTSNLSHTIARLEARLGVRLLQRTSRSVSTTQAGDALLATLEPALAGIERAVEALDRGGGVTGTLRLTATREGYDLAIRPVLAAFGAAHPDATIEVLIDYAFRDVVADRLDAGIRLGEKIVQDMVALKVGPDLRMAVVAAPGYLARHGTPVHPRDLGGHRLVNYRMIAAGTIYAWEFERDGEALRILGDGPLVFSEPAPMVEAALAGLGVAYVLEHAVAQHIGSGTLVRLLADWTPPFPGFRLYYPSRRQMRPILRAFIASLRAGGLVA